jgi:hypothetical protein
MPEAAAMTLSKRALYQGMTSVVPQNSQEEKLGFSPCHISSRIGSPF